jgi:PadR family transcriptional regulator PadR
MSKKRHIVDVLNIYANMGEKKLHVVKAREVQTKLMRGLLDLVVMQFLRTQPMHGYQIITTLRRQFGVYFGPSTIYPLLVTMEDNGQIESHWDLENERPRKVYAITPLGAELLNCTEDSLTHIYRKLGISTNKTLFKGNSPTKNYLLNDEKNLNVKPLH